MTSVRQMKYEGLQAERKRRRESVVINDQAIHASALTANDRSELAKFAAYLNDAKLPLIEQIEKHGADYLGFTPAEVEMIRAKGAAAIGNKVEKTK